MSGRAAIDVVALDQPSKRAAVLAGPARGLRDVALVRAQRLADGYCRSKTSIARARAARNPPSCGAAGSSTPVRAAAMCAGSTCGPRQRRRPAARRCTARARCPARRGAAAATSVAGASVLRAIPSSARSESRNAARASGCRRGDRAAAAGAGAARSAGSRGRSGTASHARARPDRGWSPRTFTSARRTGRPPSGR